MNKNYSINKQTKNLIKKQNDLASKKLDNYDLLYSQNFYNNINIENNNKSIIDNSHYYNSNKNRNKIYVFPYNNVNQKSFNKTNYNFNQNNFYEQKLKESFNNRFEINQIYYNNNNNNFNQNNILSYFQNNDISQGRY